MKRRRFLRSLSLRLGVLPFLPEAAEGISDLLHRLSTDLESAGTQEDLWRRVRGEFRMNPGLTHLNCGTLGATPRLVLDAVASAMREMEGNPAVKMFRWGGDQMEEVRARAAEFIGAELEEVAFTRNTTEGMNAVATGLHLKAGDQVLTTSHLEEHPLWAVERVMEYGNLSDVRILVDFIGREAFLSLAGEARFSSDRTRLFWQQALEREGMTCTRKFSREEAASSWRSSNR